MILDKKKLNGSIDAVRELFDLMSQAKRASGDSMYHLLYFFLEFIPLTGFIKVFLDAKCLPDAEDWQKSFLYGLHHSRVIVPVISNGGLART